jgi:hypothetical protein
MAKAGINPTCTSQRSDWPAAPTEEEVTMSAAKEMWIDAVEHIADDLAAGELTREEAVAQWHGMGFDWDEAHDMADEAEE